MGKQRQKKKAPKRRMNPIQRKVEQGVKEGASQLPVPTAEQVTPVVERVSLWRSLKINNYATHIVVDIIVIVRESN
jgi:hypothetical protein